MGCATCCEWHAILMGHASMTAPAPPVVFDAARFQCAAHECDAACWEVVLLVDGREVRSEESHRVIGARLSSRVPCRIMTLHVGDMAWAAVRRGSGALVYARIAPLSPSFATLVRSHSASVAAGRCIRAALHCGAQEHLGFGQQHHGLQARTHVAAGLPPLLLCSSPPPRYRRYVEQRSRLCTLGIPNVIYLVEGRVTGQSKLTPQALSRAMVSTMVGCCFGPRSLRATAPRTHPTRRRRCIIALLCLSARAKTSPCCCCRGCTDKYSARLCAR